MRQVSLIALVSVIALFTGGCMAGQEEEQAVKSSPSPQVAFSPRPPKPSPAATPFGSKPWVAQKAGSNSAVAGLIQPDLPDNVIKRIPQGQRSDPFSAVPVQPQVTVSPNPVPGGGNGPRPVPVVTPPPIIRPPQRPFQSPSQSPSQRPSQGLLGPRSPQPRNQGVTAAKPVPNLRSLPTVPVGPGKKLSSPSPKPGATAKSPPTPKMALSPVTPPPVVPELPKLPEPTQARGIEVSGVAEVGGVPMAIVKVPNEPDRYVREGQRIANGQVLVKRIEMNRGPEPVVILEQYGIEVARGVGEAPATSPGGPGQTPPGPTASLPSASPPSNTRVSPQA